MSRIAAIIFAALAPSILTAQDRASRIEELDRKLSSARELASTLQKTISELATELESLKESPQPRSALKSAPAPPPEEKEESFREQIVRPGLGGDERDKQLSPQPELFVQSRFQAKPLSGTSVADAPTNFVLTRMESRWSGRLSSKIGMGFEIQYHPAPAGSAFEIVNDAFVEYYLNEPITIRAGQFVKPFGFDIQQSSSVRESPERGIFAGYFFPGQRDRGVMVTAKLDSLGSLGHGAEIFAGAFNGNRFFVDNNRQLNYNIRLRKVLSAIPLAIGVSTQFGTQVLPPDVRGNTRQNLYGADVQWTTGRFGVRAEFVTGNMPSTLLNIDDEFSPQFRPGAHSTGGALFVGYKLTRSNQIYARYDQFNGDPVSGQNVRAFNFGLLRHVGSHSRLGVDYQFKNRASFNDDQLNTRLQISWNVVY